MYGIKEHDHRLLSLFVMLCFFILGGEFKGDTLIIFMRNVSKFNKKSWRLFKAYLNRDCFSLAQWYAYCKTRQDAKSFKCILRFQYSIAFLCTGFCFYLPFMEKQTNIQVSSVIYSASHSL